MVIFGIETTNSPELDNFIYKTNERFKNTLLFYGELRKYDNILLVKMKPLILHFYWLGAFSFITILLVWGFNKFSIFCLIIFSMGFFWSRYFFYSMLKWGLRKEGHKGKIKLISDQKTLDGVIYGTTRNN